ncbi:tRNA (guanine(9)-N(1))-methyltransferase, partial [Sticta canariensis]|nr:tRNA (guanine(9)-N(1))-methyltransferase [Sticta canariensis]
MEETLLSKNQRKKIKRHQEWEANRSNRKLRRKEKQREKKQRVRAAQPLSVSNGPSMPATTPSDTVGHDGRQPKERRYRDSIQLPVTIILDCGFDDLMMDKEITSLASQVTRCYSDNHKAPFNVHLGISSFGGRLKERFDTVLSGNHSSWKDVRFIEDDFIEAAKQAKEWMKRSKGKVLAGAFTSKEIVGQSSTTDDFGAEEVVYLTSESPDTLTELKPYSTYIVGGLVDRNRHKGICYKRAMDRGLKTAKLPIGDYMQMASRFVLATNHVSEIMVRWLELGDWGEAFLKVVPKRKGGVLKSN